MNQTPIRFGRLVQQASQERAPPIDVVNRVIQSITQCAPLPAADWSMWQAAGLSVVAAIAVLVLATCRGAWLEDPLTYWFSSLVLVMR